MVDPMQFVLLFHLSNMILIRIAILAQVYIWKLLFPLVEDVIFMYMYSGSTPVFKTLCNLCCFFNLSVGDHNTGGFLRTGFVGECFYGAQQCSGGTLE
jgi:hypothetical protein